MEGWQRRQSFMGNATCMWQAPQKLPKMLLSMVKATVVFFLMLKISGWQLEQSSSMKWSSWRVRCSARASISPY